MAALPESIEIKSPSLSATVDQLSEQVRQLRYAVTSLTEMVKIMGQPMVLRHPEAISISPAPVQDYQNEMIDMQRLIQGKASLEEIRGEMNKPSASMKNSNARCCAWRHPALRASNLLLVRLN